MFTGIVEETGTVISVTGGRDYRRLSIACRLVGEDLDRGDSIAVDGVCQTATELTPDGFAVEALAETLAKTTLGSFAPGRRVNLERAVTPSTRLGGHFVQGHVDATGTVSEVRTEGRNVYVSVRIAPELVRFCIPEGSIALDGVSLTIAALRDDGVRINIIPATWQATNLADRHVGDRMNVEVDLIGRYVHRFLDQQARSGDRLTHEKLARWGYMEGAS